MFPIRDNIPSRTTPVVNYVIILACAIVFLKQLSGGMDDSSMIEQYGMIPARVTHPERPVEVESLQIVREGGQERIEKVRKPAAPSPVPAWLTLLTCIFLHGGWMHILGNLWFLHIFGDNVEDRFGHGMFLLFYLASGVAASAAHLITDPSSSVPTIGASGAIAGVMGAYFVFYPKARVLSVIPLGFLLQMVVLPAPVFLGIWFVIQMVQGLLISGTAAGVAWWAHIGGFVVGAGGAFLMKTLHYDRPPVVERLPNSDGYGYRTPFRIRREP